MSEIDDELQTQVDNAVAGDETDAAAENDQDLSRDDENLENDDTSDLEDDGNTDDDAGKKGADGDDAADDTEEDDDDDDDLDNKRPVFSGAPQIEPFDINKLNLPRDENGKIRPEDLNKAVQEWQEKNAQALAAADQGSQEAKTLLTSQWQKVTTKFPHIAKNRNLRSIARELHLNSIKKNPDGSIDYNSYVSPLAAAKKVDKMYRTAVKSGISSQKTRKRVESAIRTESGGGKSVDTRLSSYEQAKKMASSSDPNIAAKGRRLAMRIRRQARRTA